MEWNWKMKNNNGLIDVTPFLLFESSADSDDAIITNVHHHHQEEEREKKGREQEAIDDDAESSCSTYDHSFHVNVKSHDNHHQTHGYDDEHGHGHEEDIDDDDDDKNWGESKMIGQEKRCHELCFDSSNLDDRQFWETCLAS